MHVPTGYRKLASAASEFFAAIGGHFCAEYWGDNEEGEIYFLGSQSSRLMMRGKVVGGKLEQFEFTIHDGEIPLSVFWVRANCPRDTMEKLFADLWQGLGLPPTKAPAFVGVQRELAKLL